jgi:hypothetical protein
LTRDNRAQAVRIAPNEERCRQDVAASFFQPKDNSMITKNLGMLLLAIYLILVGIIGIFGVSLGAAGILLPILALIAGILILLGK